MDNETTPITMSAADELKRIREEHLADLSKLFSLDDPPVNSEVAPRAPNEDPALSIQTRPDDIAVSPVAPLVSPSLLVPSVELGQAQNAAIEAAENLIEAVVQGPMIDSTAIDNSYNAIVSDAQPTTLDPSALTLSIENDTVGPSNEETGSLSIPTDDGIDTNPHQGDTDSPISPDFAPSAAPGGAILPYVSSGPNEFVVTVPLASNIRPLYSEIVQKFNDDLVAYNTPFTTTPYIEPSQAVIANLDQVFTKLFDTCDLPPFLDTIPLISPVQVTKHLRNTNSKFAFVGQFLENLCRAGIQKSILILARPGQIIDLLNNMMSTEGYRHVHLHENGVVEPTGALQPLTVIVASTTDNMSLLQRDYDIVIAFDHTFQQELLADNESRTPPLVLALVVTTSLQHINMQISAKIEPLWRKNILLLALCASLEEMRQPTHRFLQVHEIAELFAKHVVNPDDDDFYWNPQELPTTIFETIAACTQADGTQSSLAVDGVGAPASRKRSLGDENDQDDEITAKRPKMTQPEMVTTTALAPAIPDAVKSIIGEESVGIESKPIVQITVEKAEALAAKLATLQEELAQIRIQRDEYREIADRGDREVKSWNAFVNKIQPRYMAALRDRGTYQKKCDDALKAEQAMASNLQSIQAEKEKLLKENAALTQQLSEARESLISGNNPELAKMARLEKESVEATARSANVEKSISLARSDRDYAQSQYQEASQRALELKRENDALQAQNAELSRRADRNIVAVNELQSRNEVRELVHQLDEQKVIVRERENDLNRLHQQLASATKGRRETRQSSVPRSPRLGVSSPRTGRSVGAAISSGPVSRGASPGAMGTFEVGATAGIGSLFAGQQQGNGRYSHLRD